MKHKATSHTTDAMPNLTAMERHVAFLQSRGIVSQLKYLEVLKSHFKPENNGNTEKRFSRPN